MSLGIWFWVIYVLSLLFGVWAPSQPNLVRWAWWPLFICTGILGWEVFGAAVHR